MNIIQKIQSNFQRQRIAGGILVMLSASAALAVIAVKWMQLPVELQYVTGASLLLFGLIIAALAGLFSKPPVEKIFRYLDRTFPFLEESSALLTREPRNDMEQWQKEKIRNRTLQHQQEIRTPTRFIKKSATVSVLLLLFTVTFYFIDFSSGEAPTTLAEVEAEKSENPQPQVPVLEEMRVQVQPPDYTGLQRRTGNRGNITVPEFSMVEWQVAASGGTEKAEMIFQDGSSEEMNAADGVFRFPSQAGHNLTYQIALSNTDTTVRSEFFAVTVEADQKPKFRFINPAEQRTEVSDAQKTIPVELEVLDDFGVTSLSLNATLARGSGENVRFRERVLPFDEISGLQTNTVRAAVELHADSLEMEPGDELYFFVSATDNRPDPQTARSETWFIFYKDSAGTEQPAFATVAMDVLPEYFRSQRQIIIDTEQLLEEKPSISTEEFEKRSEAIGHDQNLLRLRYGQYLGIEDEMASGEADDHDHEHKEEGTEPPDPVAEFGHDHGSPEMNTLFADSPKAMLKESLDNMWSAEMYLRTHRPDEALPFEYRALELLKTVQQADRRYARKAGYDSPPIPVDEKRLTGEYDDFAYPTAEMFSDADENPLARLEMMIRMDQLETAEAAGWIQQAEIPEADRLYLLNRVRNAEESGWNDELKQELLERLSEIRTSSNIDPAPKRYPTLGGR